MSFRPLTDFQDIHHGDIVYVVGCAPSLWNWQRRYLNSVPAIFINSSIHFLDDYDKPIAYRIIMDSYSISEYMRVPYYARTRKAIAPLAPYTFVSMNCVQRIQPHDLRLLNHRSSLVTMFYGDNRCIAPLTGDYLWWPSLIAAITLALRMGAAEIHIAAVDYTYHGTLSHWDRTRSDTGIKPDDNGPYAKKQIPSLLLNALPLCTQRGVVLRQFTKRNLERPLGSVLTPG